MSNNDDADRKRGQEEKGRHAPIRRSEHDEGINALPLPPGSIIARPSQVARNASSGIPSIVPSYSPPTRTFERLEQGEQTVPVGGDGKPSGKKQDVVSSSQQKKDNVRKQQACAIRDHNNVTTNNMKDSDETRQELQHGLSTAKKETTNKDEENDGIQDLPTPEDTLLQEARGPVIPVPHDSIPVGAIAIDGPDMSSRNLRAAATATPNNEEICVAAEVAPQEDLEATIDSRIAEQLNRMTVNATDVAPVEEEGEDDDNGYGGSSGGERRALLSYKRVWIFLCLTILVLGVIVAVVVALTTGSSNEKSEPVVTGTEGNTTSAPTTTPLPDNSPSPTISATTGGGGSTSSCDFEIVEDTDLYGSDLASAIPLAVPFDEAIEECKAICSILPACFAFTVVDAGAQPFANNPVPLCYVKDDIPSASNEQYFTSGIKSPGSGVCSFPEATYDELTSTELDGRDLFTPSMTIGGVSTLEETTRVCRDVCSAMTNCKAFTAVDPEISVFVLNFSCYIKNGVPTHDVGAQVLANSGIKL